MKAYRLIATAVAIVALGTTAPFAQGKSGSAPKGPKATRPSTGSGRPESPGKSGSAPGRTKPHPGRGHGQDKKTGDAATTTPTPGTATTSQPNLIATKIASRPELLARVSTMLPTGMTLEQASAGFRNQGQFMAALNASKNRGLPFADLQKAMTVDGLSLGQAARQLQPTPATTQPKS